MKSIVVRKPTAEETKQMKQCPMWEKEPSQFPWHYDEKETCLILEGEASAASPEQTVTFGPGDLVIFPEGIDCTWNVKKKIRKHYKFGE
jgi:uncharacterized protein